MTLQELLQEHARTAAFNLAIAIRTYEERAKEVLTPEQIAGYIDSRRAANDFVQATLLHAGIFVNGQRGIVDGEFTVIPEPEEVIENDPSTTDSPADKQD